MAKKYDVAIIGSGVVGLSAAIYCRRLGLDIIVIGKESGGTIIKTDIVENYPGFRKISGEGLANQIFKHAKDYNSKIIKDSVVKILWKKKDCFIIQTKKIKYQAKTIIFATGSEWRKLGVKGEKEFENKGVHSCALCDGPFYKSKVVAVVGGGDSAAKEALLLSKYAKKVYVLARHDLKPEPVNMDRIEQEKKIEVIENIEVKEIKGNKFVNEVILNKKLAGNNILKLDAVFIDIGHIPLSKLAVGIGVKINKKGEIIIDKESKTNICGVWAAGDVTDTKFKQAITGVGEAVKAAYSAYEYVHGDRIICSCVDEN
jgi:thioredoxin reductase (NADPH)